MTARAAAYEVVRRVFEDGPYADRAFRAVADAVEPPLDACSGLGILNSRADLRWRAEPLPELQRGLLEVAAERARAGGTVTYAVCTVHRGCFVARMRL